MGEAEVRVSRHSAFAAIATYIFLVLALSPRQWGLFRRVRRPLVTALVLLWLWLRAGRLGPGGPPARTGHRQAPG